MRRQITGRFNYIAPDGSQGKCRFKQEDCIFITSLRQKRFLLCTLISYLCGRESVGINKYIKSGLNDAYCRFWIHICMKLAVCFKSYTILITLISVVRWFLWSPAWVLDPGLRIMDFTNSNGLVTTGHDALSVPSWKHTDQGWIYDGKSTGTLLYSSMWLGVEVRIINCLVKDLIHNGFWL